MLELGPMSQMALEDPLFSSLLWKMSPAALAKRVSGGTWKAWPYLQLLSRKLVDVAVGRCPRLIVTCPPRHGKPICKKTLIFLADGSQKRLADIQVGDDVITHLGRGRKVLAVHEQGLLGAVEITTKTGRSVTAALDHPFLTPRGWVNAGALAVGSLLCIPRKYELNTSTKKWDADFRLAGYLIGDGGVKSGSGNIYAEDPLEVEDIISCARQLSIVTRYEQSICSFNKAIPWMKYIGIYGKGAYEKVVPDWVFTSPNDKVAQFLGAYFATDGAVGSCKTVRKSGAKIGQVVGCAIEYCSVSKQLLIGVQHLLTRLNITSNLRVKRGMYKGERHYSWRLIISDRKSIENFIDTVPVHHQMKSQRLAEWRIYLKSVVDRSPQLTVEEIDYIRNSTETYKVLTTRFGVGDHVIWNIRKDIGANIPISDQYFYDEVVGLRLTTADCRCLTVEEDETFTVSDIVVHNSEIVSKWFPLWFLETFHHKRVILCSYEADFAAKWGGKVRDIIAQNQDILTARFKTKNPSMHSWELEEGGGMACAGAGGPITGKGAELLIIDDPVKNSEDAESLTMRDKLWEWWLSTARTRIEPGGGAVVMMTRWHSNDLIGRLINPESYPEKGLRDEWEVFNFPAIAEPEADLHYAQFGVMVNSLRSSALVDGFGRSLETDNSDWRDAVGRKLGEPLCPDRYDLDALMKTRGSSSPKVWYSMYQQRPGDEMDQGNVYFTYDEKVNNRPLVYNPGWQLFVSLDFNIDPMTAVIGQYDQNSIRMMDSCEILEEVVLNNSNTYAMSDVLIKRLQPYKRGYTLMVEIYGDAAGAQKTANSKKTNWQIVAEHFKLDTSIHYKFVRKKDNPNIVDRVNAVNTMLMSADGTSRLFVDGSKCPELIKDFQKVKWQTDAGGNSTGMLEKRKDNKRTHISDALGYMVEYRFGMRAKAGGRKGFMQ